MLRVWNAGPKERVSDKGMMVSVVKCRTEEKRRLNNRQASPVKLAMLDRWSCSRNVDGDGEGHDRRWGGDVETVVLWRLQRRSNVSRVCQCHGGGICDWINKGVALKIGGFRFDMMIGNVLIVICGHNLIGMLVVGENLAKLTPQPWRTAEMGPARLSRWIPL